MAELLSGTTVTISAKAASGSGADSSIVVLRALVCGLSEDFNTTFNGAFIEGQDGVAVLQDAEPWVFKVFGGWLVTQRVEYHEEEQNGHYVPEALIDIVERDDGKHENKVTDPVTWSWEALFAVYQFADQYSTRLLRQAVFEVIQLKLLQLQLKIYHLPRPDAMAFAANNLPEVSPLRQLLVHTAAHAKSIDFHPYGRIDIANLSAAEISVLPSDFLAECFKRRNSGGRATPRDRSCVGFTSMRMIKKCVSASRGWKR